MAEREAAAAAKAALERLLPVGSEIRLAGLRNGKCAERVVARVVIAEGRDAAVALLGEGHGRRYNGGRRAGWCG